MHLHNDQMAGKYLIGTQGRFFASNLIHQACTTTSNYWIIKL
jgi:hypothetical protein